MTAVEPQGSCGDTLAGARHRVDAASRERSRLRDEHTDAKGTSRELQTHASLQAASDEVAARERWLRWVEERDY
jgi:hypothetical protein